VGHYSIKKSVVHYIYNITRLVTIQLKNW